ncbi:hypothetical protein BH09MYX1_BH09MYX1_51990 [soil metagenome]
MRFLTLFATTVVAVALCGCAPSNAPPVATGSGSPSSPSSTASTSSPTKVDCSPERATVVDGKPFTTEGWTVVGTILVSMRDGVVTQLAAMDLTGATLSTHPLRDAKVEGDAAMRAAICEAGGLVASEHTIWPKPHDARPTRDIPYDVYAPAVADEAKDLALICAVPSDRADSGFAEVMQGRSRTIWLTSARWRTTMSDIHLAIDAKATDDRVGRRAVAAERGALLADVTKRAGASSCWTADALVRYGTSPVK